MNIRASTANRRLQRSLVALVLLLPACFIARVDGGPVEPGPEQFLFTMVPGGGPGEEADRAVDGIANNVDDADHLASVETPMGRLDIYHYTEVQDGQTWSCEAVVGPNSASASCADDGFPDGDINAIEAFGTGASDEWATVELRAWANASSITATAVDGTIYRSNQIEGHALIVYPIHRGQLTVQALDTNGAQLGDPVVVEVPTQPERPAPSG